MTMAMMRDPEDGCGVESEAHVLDRR